MLAGTAVVGVQVLLPGGHRVEGGGRQPGSPGGRGIEAVEEAEGGVVRPYDVRHSDKAEARIAPSRGKESKMLNIQVPDERSDPAEGPLPFVGQLAVVTGPGAVGVRPGVGTQGDDAERLGVGGVA